MGVAAAVAAAVVVLRGLIDAVAPNVAPFALLFPAVLVATLAAAWPSGVLTLVLGGGLTWFLFTEPRGAFRLGSTTDMVSLALCSLAAAMIIALAQAYRRRTAALAEGEARLEMATSAANVGIWEWRLPTNEMIYSEEAKAICGFAPGEPVTHDMAMAVTHPEDHPFTRAQAERALDPEIRDDSPYEYRILTPGGEERWVTARGRAVFETINGRPTATSYVGTLQDITDRKRAELERGGAAAHLRLALEAGRMAVWHVDGATGLLQHSPDLNRILGWPEDAQPGLEELRAGFLSGERERVTQAAREAVARGERFFEVEHRYQRPSDQALRWLLVRAEIQVNEDDPTPSAIGVVMDITERKSSEERLKLLAREVDHRANNLLAVVQSTIQLSRAEGTEALKEVLIGRVRALGRAHQLLSKARWEGAALRRLVEEELLAFSLGEAARASIEGPDVVLAPAAAQAVAMALHELATNAAKYGALSAPEGRVAVSWTNSPEGLLAIRWAETGGPRVRAPSRRGLGTTILERALAGPLNGTSRLDWRPEGVVCELELRGVGAQTAKSPA